MKNLSEIFFRYKFYVLIVNYISHIIFISNKLFLFKLVVNMVRYLFNAINVYIYLLHRHPYKRF